MFYWTDQQIRDSHPNTESAVTDMKVLLPESIVLRLMKGKTTEKYNYAKEVKTAFNVAASTFILYLTSNAVQASQAKGRKCILPDDVFKALQAADLESFIEPLKEMQLGIFFVRKATTGYNYWYVFRLSVRIASFLVW